MEMRRRDGVGTIILYRNRKTNVCVPTGANNKIILYDDHII